MTQRNTALFDTSRIQVTPNNFVTGEKHALWTTRRKFGDRLTTYNTFFLEEYM